MADASADADIQDAEMAAATNNQDLVEITFTHHGKPHIISLPRDATLVDLSESIDSTLSVPPSNQKLMISKLGLLKPPFKDPAMAITALLDKKISLLGATAKEATAISTAQEEASRRVHPRGSRPLQKVSAYKTRNWKKEQEESQYTFLTLKPLSYLPNPSRSLEFLQRLKDDAGIKATMLKHKFTVPLLTEMNPIEHTQSDHEGTSRTLGLNRNRGEVIELRLRTDAYDGYRDYKTIRNTLCHELAHNVHGPHDRNFWDLCKQIEKEVAAADWKTSGHTLAPDEEFYGGNSEDFHDHGGWSGGEFVLGAGKTTDSSSTQSQGLRRREILAKAAEERSKKMREQQQGGEGSGNGSG
ncbi:hypothetical protein HYALB_00008255 [Hymenoscyphus albidus]|uniref:WLM domain-containing protein n=1 Tax=Hymenoscyphus albidus TaxID=595503 RepID=A0A9N9LI45_9HELO|nr:hypothetical protein HYALB_00008255 [Hymenoscyphus albidus]